MAQLPFTIEMKYGALGDSGKHMAHAQEHVDRGEDS